MVKIVTTMCPSLSKWLKSAKSEVSQLNVLSFIALEGGRIIGMLGGRNLGERKSAIQMLS
jgi:hypothetical protein